jgi:GNAT superfamily N-acetyltransferase
MPTYKITKISDIEQSQLSEFYKKIYFDRHKSLINNWKWWYRFGYSKIEPLILSSNGKVLGQAGTQPIDLNINGKKVLATWFLDFSILPELRGKGLGKKLTKELMEQCPNLITFCNKNTLKIIKKFGWQDSFSIFRLARPINPLKFVPIVNKLKINFADGFFRNVIKKKFDYTKSIEPKKIENNFNAVRDSFKNRKSTNTKNFPLILRDEKWLHWRLMECPYKKDIYFFEHKNNFSIVHIFSKKGVKRLNILFSYFTDQSCDSDILNSIMSWSIDNNVDLLWAIKGKTEKSFEKIFPNKFKKPIIFSAWSSNENIFEALKNGLSNAEGIDSDIDSSMFAE